jgi:hypothetical protein
MRSELGDANKPKRRITRSRLAKPLLTSMGTITMLAASSFVVLAVSSTGSARPWDWTRADPAAAVSRYQVCGNQGAGTIGCMLSASFRPASAAPAPAGAHRALQPLVSVATVQDQVPADASGSGQATRVTPGSKPGGGSGSAAAGAHHLVVLPPGASTDDVLAACMAAMKTAQTQGAAAMKAVEVECEADLQPRCPAVRMPQAQGAAAIQEMANVCRPPSAPAPSPSPSHGGDD